MVRSEVGRLRTVLLHRPGNELQRLTPRNNDALLFDGLPWVDRAQAEHDGFAETLRSRGVEVLYLSKLLVETLADPTARAKAIQDLVSDIRLGETLRNYLLGYLADLGSEELAEIMMAGLRNDEVQGTGSLVAALYRADHFLIDPLPNLLFTRDSSVWIGDRVTITSLAMPARRRETQLTELIYTFHPRFTGVERIHGWREEYLEGGDVLALADGVLAVGVGATDSALRSRASRTDNLPARTCAHRTCRADRSRPGHHAPGHHLHHGRRRRGGDVPECRTPAVCHHGPFRQWLGSRRRSTGTVSRGRGPSDGH